MANKDLNIVLGIDTKQLDKALGKAQRKLNSFAFKAQNIGSTLTQSLTLPIIGVGAAAVKSFADFDKMRKGLEAVAGGAEEAEKQMSRLKVVALNPGISLQQAVQGTIRLQAVGLQAREAEETLLQFSKAVTLAGGNADDLGEVTRQLGQMISKGKILSSDFKVIQERVPAIGLALEDAFGTQNIEQIRETGISSRDFVDQLTKAISQNEKFQSVQGGLANSFDNFRQAVTASLVELGDSINKSLDLEKALSKLAKRLSDAVDFFKNLDDSTKKSIVRAALFTATLGPIFFGLGKVVQIGGVLVQTLRLITKATLGNIVKFRDYISSLKGVSIAQSALKLGPLALAFAAIGTIIVGLRKKYLDLTEGARKLAEIQRAGASAADLEQAKIKPLITTLNNENASREEKLTALNQLKQVNSAYFGDLDLEKGKVEGLAEAYKSWSDSIVAKAEIAVAARQLEEIQEKLDGIYSSVEDGPGAFERFGRGLLDAISPSAGFGSFDKLGKQGEEVKRLLSIREKVLGKYSEASKAFTNTFKEENDILSKPDAPTGPGGQKLDLSGVSSGVSGLGFISAPVREEVDAANRSLSELKDIIASNEAERLNWTRGLSDTEIGISRVTEQNNRWRESTELQIEEQRKLNAVLEAQAVVGQYLQNTMTAFGDAFGVIWEGTQDAAAAIKEFEKKAVESIINIINYLIKEAVTAAIANTAIAGGPLGVALAAGAAGLITGIIKGSLSKAPRLAQGGIVPPGYPNDTYPAFLSSGETVVPPGKLPNLGGGGGYIAETRIDMRELIIGLRREETNLGRIE
jgi:tape measure domain-containing protein